MEVCNVMTINPRRPTQARPGSEEKIAILRARAEAGIPLHNKRDAILETMPACLMSDRSEVRSGGMSEPFALDILE